MKNIEFPRIKQLGLKVFTKPCDYIDSRELQIVLKEHNIENLFHKYLGTQTMYYDGQFGHPYPWDVEAVLERIFSGRIEGTQLLWD